jgi:HD-GYP domain-containing protein (c-di-GMP phosphodiesterase class II)
VEGIVSLQLKRRPFRGWWVSHRKEIPHEGSLHLLGVFGAVVASLYPWALLLLLAPVMIVYRSLRDGLQLQVQTRETVETLADIVDMRDHYTFEHSKRVAEMARDLAMAMKLGADEAEQIYVAARVHDVGKIGIKGQILLKEGKLTEDEWREMSSHPEVGAKLVSKLPEFRKGRELILSHHERYDGKGYPRALRGEEIPLGARIITVVDSFDAMTSNRSYRTARDPEYVLAELAKGRGTQFDPRVVDAFLKALKEKAPAAPSSAEHSHAQAFPT